jgi:hypothetical protein
VSELAGSAQAQMQASDLEPTLPPPPPVSRIRLKDASSPDAFEPFRCVACGELIGVYEPLVVQTAGASRTTSRAADPDLRAGAYYHRGCC